MKYNFFKSYYFQNENTEISSNLISEQDFYYRFYYEPQLGINVGERNINGKFDTVYYVGGNLKALTNYHNSIFKNINTFQTIEHVSNLTVIVKTYMNDIFLGALIINCNNRFEEERVSLYNEKFELLEYREFLSNENEVVNKQRIFFPSTWNLVEEEI